MESLKMESTSSSTSGNSVVSLSSGCKLSKPQNFSAGKLRGGKKSCLYGCGYYLKDNLEVMRDHCFNDCPRRFEVENFENEFNKFVNIRFPDGRPAEVAYNQHLAATSANKAKHQARREKFTQEWMNQLQKLKL